MGELIMTVSGIKEEELYEQFQQLLNDCPVKIIDYQDFTDEFQVNFKMEAD